MMAGLQTGYQSLPDTEDETVELVSGDDDAPVHVLSNDTNGKAHWNHIENLDDFFTRVYAYHQRHGFLCMLLEDVLQIGQFLFIVLFTGFLIDCVDYKVLFSNDFVNTKHTFQDIIIKPCQCGFSIPEVAVCMIIAFSFLGLRILQILYNAIKYWEIHQFYRVALKIDSNELENKTWHDIQTRLIEVQAELQMCIHKNELTSLDIYHRILRFKNYMVAMVNKSVLPLKHKLPLIGDFCYLSNGLKFNLEMILFGRWGPCSAAPFENSWHLKNEYRSYHNRMKLSEQLSKKILMIGVINLLLSPLIFLWQILYLFFVYGELVQREPSFLGTRQWTLFARLHLRHFNELDHELNYRLRSAYDVSNKYLSGFTSPLLILLAKTVTFLAGAILVVLILLTVYDEDTLKIEHMITLMTGCGVILTIGRSLIPAENAVFWPEGLMNQIITHIHYEPDWWTNKAHTSQVRDEFSQLFHLKALFILMELASPLVTPVILIFCLRPRTLQIVDFLRNFTVEVVGVGDVCSFAQLDVKKHGHPKWSGTGGGQSNQLMQAELGKTELSLVHFKLTNPMWEPSEAGKAFLSTVNEMAVKDAMTSGLTGESALSDSLSAVMQSSLPSLGMDRISVMMQRSALRPSGSRKDRNLRGAVSAHVGPISKNEHGQTSGILDAISQSTMGAELLPLMDGSMLDYGANELGATIMYVRELHKRDELSSLDYGSLDAVRQIYPSEYTASAFHELHDENEELNTSSSASTSHAL